MTPFGVRLRELRAGRGLTQKDLAARLEVSAAYLSALEHGRRGRPGPGLVVEICGHLNLTWDEAEELKRLALISHPKVTLDTAGLGPAATELANRFAERLPGLGDKEVEELMGILSQNPKKNA